MSRAPKNRILPLRKAANLTQGALAALVGTSQQQIQRIETGVGAVRLELAQRIATALGVELPAVFPALRLPRRKEMKTSGATREALERADIDPDPLHWCMRLYMFDGRMFDFRISSAEKSRLESIIGTTKSFLVFSTDERNVAVNNEKIAACQFLYDAINGEPKETDIDEFDLELHLVASKDVITFDVVPDTTDPLDDEVGAESQLQSLFIHLDGFDGIGTVEFDDADAERVYLNPREILILQVPLVCCEPALWDSVVANEDEHSSPDAARS